MRPKDHDYDGWVVSILSETGSVIRAAAIALDYECGRELAGVERPPGHSSRLQSALALRTDVPTKTSRRLLLTLTGRSPELSGLQSLFAVNGVSESQGSSILPLKVPPERVSVRFS